MKATVSASHQKIKHQRKIKTQVIQVSNSTMSSYTETGWCMIWYHYLYYQLWSNISYNIELLKLFYSSTNFLKNMGLAGGNFFVRVLRMLQSFCNRIWTWEALLHWTKRHPDVHFHTTTQAALLYIIRLTKLPVFWIVITFESENNWK